MFLGLIAPQVDNPIKDDLYVYKITRDAKITYGIIKIGSITTVTVDTKTSITIDLEFGEGEVK